MLIHQLWGFIPAILEFGRWRQKDQEFMVIFNYIESLSQKSESKI